MKTMKTIVASLFVVMLNLFAMPVQAQIFNNPGQFQGGINIPDIDILPFNCKKQGYQDLEFIACFDISSRNTEGNTEKKKSGKSRWEKAIESLDAMESLDDVWRISMMPEDKKLSQIERISEQLSYIKRISEQLSDDGPNLFSFIIEMDLDRLISLLCENPASTIECP